jgi:hypothetical protein
MKRDVEQSLKQLIAVLLTLRAKCSFLALKPALSSPYLPTAKGIDCILGEMLNQNWEHMNG